MHPSNEAVTGGKVLCGFRADTAERARKKSLTSFDTDVFLVAASSFAAVINSSSTCSVSFAMTYKLNGSSRHVNGFLRSKRALYEEPAANLVGNELFWSRFED